jgi:flagellar biosynthetic protein FlhB
MGMTLAVGTLALSALLPGAAATLVAKTQASVVGMDPHATTAQLMSQTGDAILTMLLIILPLAMLVLIAGVAGNLISGGLVFAPRAIRFDPSRLNPISGLKRIADKQAMVRLGLAAAKLSILVVISWQVVGSRVPFIVATSGSSASAIAGACLSAIFQLGLTITVLLAVVALVDFVVQRRKASQAIKMTKQEVRQEYREQEGDPQVRGARKRRARQMAFARMMDAIPTSDVVVTNPTTLAVALKYDSLTMRAPKIVAKGQRLMAERIKQIARENKVPIVEDKPLARALFTRPMGAEVPAHLYRAVARLLVLVHQARFSVGARPGGGRRPARGWAAEQNRAASSGLGDRPWWADASAAGAAGLSGGLSGGPQIDAGRDGAAGEWTEGLGGEPDPEVDEEALARAMAQDELRDVTPQDLVELDAALTGTESVAEPTELDARPDAEEQER